MINATDFEGAIIFAPVGRDATIACAMLDEAGIAAHAVGSLHELEQKLSMGVGFIVLTEEAFREADTRTLSAWLGAQPEWSDIPIILLTSPGGGLGRNPAALRSLDILGNVTFIERPFHPTTLVSLARAALRSRQRQYDARSRLEAIRTGEEQLKVAIAAAQLGSWSLNLPDRALTTSTLCKAHYGRREGDAFTFSDLLNCIAPDDLSFVRSAMAQALEGYADYNVEYRCLWPDGTVHWVHVRGRLDEPRSGRPVIMSGVSLDITDRKRSEAALQRSEERFRAAIDAVHGVLWTNNAAGEMTGAQPGWSELTGQTPDEYQGYGWASAVHPEDAAATIEAWNAAVAEHRPFVFEHRVKLRNGEWGLFAIRAIPALERDGSIREWVGVHTDITAQRATERELAELANTLEERVASATAELAKSQEHLLQSQKLETIGQLTGGVAHDFNNLLTPIVGSLDLLRSKLDGDERAQRWVSAGLQSAERARQLVNRLLAFARRQALEPQAVDVPALVAGMQDLITRSIGPLIEVDTRFSDALPPARVDPNQLELSILNLCVNARDAMPDGGRLTIAVGLDDAVHAFPGAAPGQYVSISVTDTGSGMSADTMQKAIEPFYTTKGVGEGTGLGLSMVHGLAGQLGGGMTIDSTLGAGTRVTVWLPVSDGTAVTRTEVAETYRAPARSATVLLVDDEELVRFATADMLRDAGYVVVEASSGLEARQIVQEGFTPDVLVTDQLMPGLKGTEFARELRVRQPSVPVLIVTGYADVEDLTFPRIGKPFAAAQLVEKVRILVEGAPAATDAGR